MALSVQQIYTILNEVSEQTLGQSAIKVVDTGSFIALGNNVLNSQNNVEPFLNTLTQRIGKTVLVNRIYRSHYANLIKGEMEFGAIMQKIGVDMPEVVEDDSLTIVDGQSVDQYIVKKPVAHQWLFVKEVTYQIFVTIQERWLRQAFTNESAMGGFISLVFEKVRMKLELCIENLCRAAINNYCGVVYNGHKNQVVDLVSMYNSETGKSVPTGFQALHDKDFLMWTTGTIRELGRALETASVMYNAEGQERFTPIRNQNLALLNKFRTQLETVAYSTAFNVDYLKLIDNYLVPFWQASGTSPLDYDTQSTVNVNVANTDGSAAAVTIKNLVGVLFDDDALGAFRRWKSTRTTPMNARGLYTNTFWHEGQMWFNAFDENFILLTLN